MAIKETHPKFNATALIYAAANGRFDVVRVLIELGGADPNAKQGQGYTALEMANNRNHDDIVQYLLKITDLTKIKAKVTSSSDNKDEKASNLNQQMIDAIVYADPVKVEKLLQQGAWPNTRTAKCCSYSNATALICAACSGITASVEALLKHGADLESRDQDGGTPLIWASRAGFMDIVNALLKAGAKIDAHTTNGDTALVFAAYNGHFELVKLLVSKGANRKLKPKHGSSAASLATQRGFHKIAAYLESFDHDVDDEL